MITEFGMSERYRNITCPRPPRKGWAGAGNIRRHQEYIDNETARLINTRYAQVLERLKANRETLDLIAKKLLEKEVLDGAEFESLAQNLVIA